MPQSDSRRRGRPRGSRGEQLLAVARDVILERGLVDATMSEVAARAQISKASLYREHPSKDALFAAVVRDWAARGRNAMQPALEALLAAPDLKVGLLDLAATIQAATLAPEVVRMRRLVAGEADRLPDVAARYVADSWDSNIAALGRAIAELHARGDLDVPDPLVAAHQLTWLTVGGPLNDLTLAGGAGTASAARLEVLADAAVETFLARYSAAS